MYNLAYKTSFDEFFHFNLINYWALILDITRMWAYVSVCPAVQ